MSFESKDEKTAILLTCEGKRHQDHVPMGIFDSAEEVIKFIDEDDWSCFRDEEHKSEMLSRIQNEEIGVWSQIEELEGCFNFIKLRPNSKIPYT